MAEALGLAASVIAVVDITGKAITLSVKLKSLWDEIKDAPSVLLEKAEELQDLDEFLRDAESQASFNSIPNSAWNDAILQKAIRKARAAMGDLQQTIDGLSLQVNDKRRHRRKVAAAKVVIKRESLEKMERKIDRALGLFKMVQGLYCATMTNLCAAVIVQRLPEPLDAPVITMAADSSIVEVEGVGMLKLSKSFLNRASAPTRSSDITKGSTLFGRISFGFGDNTYQLSLRTPNWLAGTVYSVMAQRSVLGWQFNLAAYPVIENLVELADVVASDDTIALQKYIHENALTPMVHGQGGQNLMHLSATSGAVEVTKWLLSSGLRPGSFSECRRSTPLEFVINRGTYFGDEDAYLEILKLLVMYTPDYATDTFDIWILLTMKKSFSEFRDVQRIVAPDYSSVAISTRIIHVLFGISQSFWTWDDAVTLIPEFNHLTPELLESFRGAETLSIGHVLANGVASDLLRSDDQRQESSQEHKYRKVLGEAARLHPACLTFTAAGYDEASITPFAMFLMFLLDNFANFTPEILGQNFHLATLAWVTCLHANGIDLLDYGRREKEIYESDKGGFYPQRGRLPGWCREKEIAEDGSSRVYHFRIIGITYGSLPEQWKVWWTQEDAGYAEEFWQLVEGLVINVPGSWVEDPDDKETDNPVKVFNWDGSVVPPLVWSEYRKIRPPI